MQKGASRERPEEDLKGAVWCPQKSKTGRRRLVNASLSTGQASKILIPSYWNLSSSLYDLAPFIPISCSFFSDTRHRFEMSFPSGGSAVTHEFSGLWSSSVQEPLPGDQPVVLSPHLGWESGSGTAPQQGCLRGSECWSSSVGHI